MSLPKNFRVQISDDAAAALALNAAAIGGPDHTANQLAKLWLENISRIPPEKTWKALEAIRPFQHPKSQ